MTNNKQEALKARYLARKKAMKNIDTASLRAAWNNVINNLIEKGEISENKLWGNTYSMALYALLIDEHVNTIGRHAPGAIGRHALDELIQRDWKQC